MGETREAERERERGTFEEQNEGKYGEGGNQSPWWRFRRGGRMEGARGNVCREEREQEEKWRGRRKCSWR